MPTTHFWDKEIPVDLKLIQYIDQSVRSKCPPNTQFHSITPSGSSYWARTAKISASDSTNNLSTPFFLKVHQGPQGKDMASCEYHAMTLLHNAHFFLCCFTNLSNKIPSVANFPALIANFHKNNKNKSPTGEFGFPITMPNKIFDAEEKTHSPDEKFQKLRQNITTKVIPRLLRPLETEGRVLKPTLVHSDLWDGNASVDVDTGKPVIFDATPLCIVLGQLIRVSTDELGPWWCPRYKMTDEYIEEYIKHFPKSEPVEDFEDRGAFYNLRFDLHASSLYLGNLKHRQIAINTMKRPLDKYPLGYEWYA
ncbi:hypothetical protein QBC38DRAFT_512208 [Podospora fimiseda]|uniref:protein-ribulosamine 3-kinase n=1 Tax=Podospora fimiseda TaxID=252190 RepID=A0AAN7BIA9_9PEZI|nr:hypothetical protein QBC38DRAFT_512208 [Podospora fimiseda]